MNNTTIMDDITVMNNDSNDTTIMNDIEMKYTIVMIYL